MGRSRWLSVLTLLSATALVNACRTDAGSGPAARPTEATTVARPVTSVRVGRASLLEQSRVAVGARAGLLAVDDGDGVSVLTSGAGASSEPPLGPETTFRVGSITKVVVAALVLDAVRRGQVELDADVATLVPGVLRPGPTVTVRQLLNHTSGIFNAGDEGDVVADIERLADPVLRSQASEVLARYRAGESVPISAELYVAIAETHDRYFAPGTGFHYSNANYQLATMVLERVTGTSLPQLYNARIAAPLGLRRSAIATDRSLMPELHGFRRTPDGAEVDDTANVVSLGNGGSGGLISTASELLTIVRAVVADELLEPKLAAEMRHPTKESKDSYGLGLATYRLRCGDYLGHGGSIAGTNSIALVSEDGRRGLVVVLNIDTEPDPDMTAIGEALLCA